MVVGDTGNGGVHLAPAPSTRGGSVRHFDQLSEGEQEGFLRLYHGETSGAASLSAGEVIVFTDYYRVVGESAAD